MLLVIFNLHELPMYEQYNSEHIITVVCVAFVCRAVEKFDDFLTSLNDLFVRLYEEKHLPIVKFSLL